ncbi:MAG: HAMP domain-containing sensor histidine kinase [Actinomycetota bacterium]
MNRPSLRTVMLWPILATLIVGAVALGVYVERSVARDLRASVDDELTRAVTGGVIGAEGPGGGRLGLPEPPDGQNRDPADAERTVAPIQVLIDGSGAILDAAPDEAEALFTAEQLATLAGTEETRTVEGDPRYRVRTVARQPDNTLVVAFSLEQVDNSMTSLRRNLLIGGVGLIAVQAVVVWLIAGAVARPVTRMSDVAHRIAEGDLDAHVGPAEGPQETATLATDLSSMLTTLRETIEIREEAAADATRARDDMARFIADASHELRTPLTALKGYSDLHRNGMLDGDGLDRAMDRIGDESERLTRLVTDLLKLARPSDVSEPVDLAAIVSAVGHDIRAAHPDRRIGVSGVDGDADRTVVTGDPSQLHQAVLNLAANACHHTPAGTPVELAVVAENDRVRVSVTDHGPGVDPADADQLFLPFTRGDSSRSRRSHDGAGLGLALVHQIVERHRGAVAVTDTEGGGATFTMNLPRSAPSSGEPQNGATVAVEPVTNL